MIMGVVKKIYEKRNPSPNPGSAPGSSPGNMIVDTQDPIFRPCGALRLQFSLG